MVFSGSGLSVFRLFLTDSRTETFPVFNSEDASGARIRVVLQLDMFLVDLESYWTVDYCEVHRKKEEVVVVFYCLTGNRSRPAI